MAWARKLPSKRWQGQYRVYGKVRSVEGTFLRKTEALADAQEEERKLRNGEWIDPKLARESFEAFASKWLEGKKRRKPKTFASYESTLRLYVLPYFGKSQLRAISREVRASVHRSP